MGTGLFKRLTGWHGQTVSRYVLNRDCLPVFNLYNPFGVKICSIYFSQGVALGYLTTAPSGCYIAQRANIGKPRATPWVREHNVF